jgi:hypothetical protein
MAIRVQIGNVGQTMNRIFNDGVGIFTSETCARYFAPYVPFKRGHLSQTYTTTPYKITYEMPYAKPLYKGRNLNFSKLQHPQATSEWDKASMAVNRGKIAKEITQYIKRG